VNHRRRVNLVASWLPALLWMATIAWFSTAEFGSDKTSAALSPLFQWLLPYATEPQLAALHASTRKAAHIIEYAILSCLWFVALTGEHGFGGRHAAWIAVLVAIGWAVLDELHQAIVPNRTASAMDIGIDTIGALAAAAVARYGGERVFHVATAVLLWAATAGGALIIINLTSGRSRASAKRGAVQLKLLYVR
jgi:VanZ family protein